MQLSEEWDATPGLPEAFYAHEYLAEFGSRSLEYLNNIVNFLGDDDSEVGGVGWGGVGGGCVAQCWRAPSACPSPSLPPRPLLVCALPICMCGDGQ